MAHRVHEGEVRVLGDVVVHGLLHSEDLPYPRAVYTPLDNRSQHSLTDHKVLHHEVMITDVSFRGTSKDQVCLGSVYVYA